MNPETLLPGFSVWDKDVIGLHLRSSPLGNRAWYLYYRVRGTKKERRPKLGHYPTFSLAQARQTARELLQRVALGEDPSGEWKAKRKEMTVDALFQRCYKEYWSKQRFIDSGWAKNVMGYYARRVEPEFGTLRISDVSLSHIRKWHAAGEEMPIESNRSLEVLSRMLRFAEEQELLPPGSNPCPLIRGHSEKKRSRYASVEELKRIGVELLKHRKTHPREVAFIYLLMFTGARPSSLLRARRDELQGNMLRFDGKSTADSGEKECVVIPDIAMTEIVDRMPLREDGLLIGGDMPVAFWDRVRTDAGCPDLWARDLRRTFATYGLSGGVAIGILAELLNHKSTQTTRIYAKLLPQERLLAANHIAGGVYSLLTPT